MLRLVFPFPSLWKAKNAQEWSKSCGLIIQPRFLVVPTAAGTTLKLVKLLLSPPSMRLDKPDRVRGIYNKIVYFCLLSQKIVTIYAISVRSINDSLNYSSIIGPQRISVRFLAKTGTIDYQADEQFPFLFEFHISATLNSNAFVILRCKR